MFSRSLRRFDIKTLWARCRCVLRLIPSSNLTSCVIFCLLYSVAEYKFTSWYFALGQIWKPAFPLSWRILFLLLFVVPVFAFLQLLCLVLQHWAPANKWWRRIRCSSRSRPSQEYSMLPRSESTSLEERFSGLRLSREEGESPLRDIEAEPGSPALPFMFQHHASNHRVPFTVTLQFVLWLAVLCSSLWLGVHYQQPGDVRYLPMIEKASARFKRAGYGNQEKIFIAAMFYNNEGVIPYWSDSIIKAILYLGTDNVFVSILESGSSDQSPSLLRHLDQKLATLNVQKRILIQDKAVTKPDDMGGNNRIDFLSALRNRVLEPLVEKGGYDKVIFSNDIYIEPETILELLFTSDGQYDMVCGMDYGHFGLYDMWVLRDRRGRLASGIWPYFFDAEDYEAMKAESPVPVFSCWNGIVIFDAEPVIPIHLRSNRTLSKDPLPYSLPATHPAASDPSLLGPSPALTPPIGFRASVPGECFSSESFLLPYDFRRVFNLQRIYTNPRVIVGYKWRFYAFFKWFMRHPVLKWWIEKMYDGAWMQKAIMVVGNEKEVWQWDGGDCHPWW